MRSLFLALFLPILIFASETPSAWAELKTGMAADMAIGQPNFTTATANEGGRSARSINLADSVYSDGKKLFVVDFSNHRVLIWNSIPTSNFAAADLVLGQPDFSSGTANNGGRSASSLSSPRGVFSDGTRLYVSEIGNDRVLIWNKIPTSSSAPADIVLGQPDFNSGDLNNGGLSARSLLEPRGIWTVGEKLIISDDGNSRVLIWNSIPTSNFAPADVVLGQPDFGQRTGNNGGRSARSLAVPRYVCSDGIRLYVADRNNHRVLIWNSIPSQNFAPADIVLGQPDFTKGTANPGGVGPRTLSAPHSVFADGKRLFVSEQDNNRVLVWTKIPTANFTPADIVLGQPDFNSSTADPGGVSARTLDGPHVLVSDGKRIYVAEQNNNRVLIFNIGTSAIDLSPQFEQGKAVLGKVFWDWNGNGVQDSSAYNVGAPFMAPDETGATNRAPASSGVLLEEKGIEGVRVVSDTGIYAITDQDGKYHFPYIETGQRLLKIDPSTLPEGAIITTESPRKVTITEGILTKVSFGIRHPEAASQMRPKDPDRDSSALPGLPPQNDGGKNASATPGSLSQDDSTPFLKVTITQDPTKLSPHLSITAEKKEDRLLFTIDCNYYRFIKQGRLTLYDENLNTLNTFTLPQPLPYQYEIPIEDIHGETIHYQLSVFDSQGNEDRTAVGQLRLHK